MNAITQYITKYFHSMYYVTITVLLVVAAVESIGHEFPVNLIVAVLAASLLDVAVKKLWLKRTPTVPLSAIITGLIIGSVSVNVPVSGVLMATILAILSKFIIRMRGSHVFNPAVFGVVTSRFFNPAAHVAVTHSLPQVVEGFGPGGFTVHILLVPLLLFANYKARKLWISIPFLITTALLFNSTGLISLNSLNIRDIFSFLEVMPYYFAFIIVSEPKTSPYPKKEQVLFGVSIAILSVLVTLLSGSHAGALVVLLLGNLIYVLYRATTNKKMILIIVGTVIALTGLYFGVNRLIDQIPSHVPLRHGLE